MVGERNNIPLCAGDSVLRSLKVAPEPVEALEIARRLQRCRRVEEIAETRRPFGRGDRFDDMPALATRCPQVHLASHRKQVMTQQRNHGPKRIIGIRPHHHTDLVAIRPHE